MKRTILSIMALGIIFTSCNYKEKKAEREAKLDIEKTTLIAVGQNVPEFNYITLENDTININELKGNVVFINFFATSYPICMKELPFVESDIWAKYKDKSDFKLIAFGREHVADEMISFKEKTGYTFNIVPDPGRKIYSLFAERYIPRNVILDREGKIIYQATGFDNEEFVRLKDILEKELNK